MYSNELQFPSCIRLRGWKQTTDNLIKFNMRWLPWWARCLRQSKAVCSVPPASQVGALLCLSRRGRSPLTHFGKTGLACLINCGMRLTSWGSSPCTTVSVKGHTLDLRGPDKVRGAQVSAFSLPLAACRRTLPTPARCQLLQECQCKPFGRHGRAFCKWITAIARCEVHRQCLSAQDLPHGRVGRQSSRRGSERRAFSLGCG